MNVCLRPCAYCDGLCARRSDHVGAHTCIPCTLPRTSTPALSDDRHPDSWDHALPPHPADVASVSCGLCSARIPSFRLTADLPEPHPILAAASRARERGWVCLPRGPRMRDGDRWACATCSADIYQAVLRRAVPL